MSDNYVQHVSATGTTTSVATVNSVVAGNSLVDFFYNGQDSTPATLTVADVPDGAHTAQGAVVGDNTNNIGGRAFTLVNASAGTHTVTGTTVSLEVCEIHVVEIGSSSGASAFSGANQAFQNSPGTGGDALTSGSITTTAAATIIAISNDGASVAGSDEPTQGTGFTSRLGATSSNIGAYRLESGAFAANHAATATAITGTHQFITIGVSILNGGAVAATGWGRFLAFERNNNIV